MVAVATILEQAAAGDPRAASELLPLVYNELRKLAEVKLAAEKPGQTLQPTALVHEAYLRLVGNGRRDDWNGRGHFFAAAAEAMRRILLERARRKHCRRNGGGGKREPLDGNDRAVEEPDPVSLLALNDALEKLEAANPRQAELVKLRYFAGFTLPEVAIFFGVSQSTAESDWTYAKAWLKRELNALG